jgi:hypothetical protein
MEGAQELPLPKMLVGELVSRILESLCEDEIQLSSFVDDLHSDRFPSETSSVVELAEFLVTDPEVPGSIPGATRFSEK